MIESFHQNLPPCKVSMHQLDWTAVSLRAMLPSCLDFQLRRRLWARKKSKPSDLKQEKNGDTKPEWLGPTDGPSLKRGGNTVQLCKAQLMAFALAHDGVPSRENLTQLHASSTSAHIECQLGLSQLGTVSKSINKPRAVILEGRLHTTNRAAVAGN